MTAPAHRDCTAFRLADLRTGPHWPAGPDPAGAGAGGDTVVHVWHDDLSVVTDPLVPDGAVLLDAAAAAGTAWQRFCRETLQLTTPAPQNNGGSVQ